MAATFVIHLPQRLIADAGGLREGDVLRYVSAEHTVLVVKVLGFRENWFVKSEDECVQAIIEAEVEVLPESRAADATLKVKVEVPDG